MRDYQRKTGNKYILPKNLYKQTISQLRDYPRLREMADDILHESAPPSDGQPRGNVCLSDVVAEKAIKRERLMETISIIEEEKEAIEGQYRTGVWNNILYETPLPNDADRSTYGRHKSKFVYEVARRLFFL